MDPTLLFFRPNVFEVEDEPFVRFEGPSILTQVSKPTANQQLCSQAGTYIKCNLSRVVNNPGSAPPKRILCSKIKTTFLIDEAFAGLSSSLREFIHFCYRQITHFSQCCSILTSYICEIYMILQDPGSRKSTSRDSTTGGLLR